MTCFTRMRLYFITSEIKTLHYLVKCSGARVAKARVPEIDTGGESEVVGGSG
jgi:hypothetical protein